MTGLLIDTNNKDLRKVTVTDLHDYYEAMHCNSIEVCTIQCFGYNVSVICDEEALYKDSPLPSIYDKEGNIMFWNSVILAGVDPSADDFVDLPADTEKEIRKHIVYTQDEIPGLQL